MARVSRRRRGGKRPRRRTVNVLPSLLTLGNLVSGLLSIVHTMDERYVMAAWLIVLGGVFDLSDGRVARLTHAVSDFGREMDSLSDLVTFGCAPAILAYANFGFVVPGLEAQTLNRLALAGLLLFPCAAAIRLARFNLRQSELRMFIGMPSPAAAGCLLSVTLMVHDLPELRPIAQGLALPYSVLLSCLMVSTLRYPKRGIFVVRRRTMPAYLMLFVALAAFFVIMKGTTMFVIGVAYLSLGLLDKLSRGRLTVPGQRGELPKPPESQPHTA